MLFILEISLLLIQETFCKKSDAGVTIVILYNLRVGKDFFVVGGPSNVSHKRLCQNGKSRFRIIIVISDPVLDY